MWRRTKLIARKALTSRQNVSAQFRLFQSFPKVLQSQSKPRTVASAESQFILYNSESFTNSFCQNHRFFSSNPSFQNEEPNQSNDSGDSRLDFDENSSFGFSESLVSEPNDMSRDRNGFTVCSRLNFDETSGSRSSESFPYEVNNVNQDGKGFSVDSEFGINESASSSSLESKSLIQETFDSSQHTDGVVSRNVSNEPVLIVCQNDGEKVEDLLSLLQSSGPSGSLEYSLEDMGLFLNEELAMRVLATPFVPGENLVSFFKWILKKNESLLTTEMIDLLVKAISSEIRTRDAYALWDLFKMIGEKEIRVLTADILNQLISLLSKLGKGKAALEVLDKFDHFGCLPDSDTYYWTIDALCRRSIFDWASSVCDKMVMAEKLSDSKKLGKIISHMCRGKKLKDAHSIYMLAKENNKYPPQSSVNFLINSLCGKKKPDLEDRKAANDKTTSNSQVEEVVSQEEKGNIYLALKMLDDLPTEECKNAIRSFSFVISGLCRIKDVQEAKKLLFKMIEAGPPPGYTIFNTIITGFSRTGDIEEATKLIHVMQNRGLKPDVYTYAIVMSSYVDSGAIEDAHRILDDAKKKHQKLSPIIYYILIRGYSKLERFDMARKLIGEMKEYGIQPKANEYKKLIKSFCLKALDWDSAGKLLQEMQESGLNLDELTKSLVKAVKELEEEGVASQAVTATA